MGRRASSDGGLPRGRHNLTRGEVVFNQRRRLLEAVPEAATAKGYGLMTVEDIAARAGVSRRTFYENFRDVESCFIASYRHCFEQVAAAAGGAVGGHDGEWQDRTRVGMRALLRFLAERPALSQMVVVEVLAAGSTAVFERDRAVQLLAVLLGDDAMEATGQQAPPLWQEVIAGAILQLIYREVSAQNTHLLEGLLPTIMYMVTVAFHGPTGAAERTGQLVEIPDHA